MASLLQTQLRAQGAVTAARRRSRVRVPASTKPLERKYAKQLLEFLAVMQDQLRELIDALPALTASADADRLRRIDGVFRTDVGETRRIREMIERARIALSQRFSSEDLENLAEQFASETNTLNRRALADQMKSRLGIDVLLSDQSVRQLTDAFVGQNVSLIRSLPERALSEIETSVIRGVRRGTPHREIAKGISERVGVSERRARVIARNEVSSLMGQLTAERHQDLGLETFIWRTVNDERVRPEHRQRNGKVYRYSEPPNGELPGEPVNCRCFAEPTFDELEL